MTRYGRQGASSRLRSLQFIPALQRSGIEASVAPFFDDAALLARYESGGYGLGRLAQAYVIRLKALLGRGRFDLLWIEKEALPWLPAWLELGLLDGVPYVLDYDDALFHQYDLHASRWVRALFGHRLDKLMANSRLVVAGNEYLAQRAGAAGAERVEIVPTVVDLERYADGILPERVVSQPPRVVWIGSPSTVHYLADIREQLVQLRRCRPYTLSVIGGHVDWPEMDVECRPWSELSEVADIRAGDVGIMPLTDSPWERGKCGYKLVQYMACGLPVVASPVGVNCQLVRDGWNGFLTQGREGWQQALGPLLEDADLRRRLGANGRRQVESQYCIQNVAPRLIELFKQIGRGQ